MAESSPAFVDIEREELARLTRRVFRLRAFIVPIPMTLMIVFAVLDGAVWRSWLIGISATILVVSTTAETLVFRNRPLPRQGVPTIFIGAVFTLLLALATGGLESPILFIILVISGVSFITVSRNSLRWAIVALQLTGLWTMFLLQVTGAIPHLVPFGGGAHGRLPTYHLALLAGVLSFLVCFVTAMGTRARDAYTRMATRVDATRNAALQSHAQHAQELTTLAAEIAHEIKNPLASIKGLAALVARDADSRNAERSQVLCREIERMGTIVEDFLNFSRPLGPLAREEVDLAELCRGVVALHEGVLHTRGVSCRVVEGRVSARCDRRKTWQILMNLVQNAVEASPAGAHIDVRVATDEDGVRIAVEDRGNGLDGDMSSRAFEPGFTSKPSGSGLGLTVARGLARQHGGELSLAARTGGGVSAVLTLPRGAS